MPHLLLCVICWCDPQEWCAARIQTSSLWHGCLIIKSYSCLLHVDTLFQLPLSLPLLSSFLHNVCVCVMVCVRVWFTLKGPHSSSEAWWWPEARQAYNRALVVWRLWSCVSSFRRDVRKMLLSRIWFLSVPDLNNDKTMTSQLGLIWVTSALTSQKPRVKQ